ncbi:MAG: Rne/Rng family ribonuclease [Kiritimatiellae bacterium]|nr:Rne/Rng family ribonuclease [Kiritimatiellia bacterium]
MIRKLLQAMFGRKPVKNQIIINAERLETRVAVLQNGELTDFFVERRTDERIVGSVFKGRIQNLEDSLQAAFIDIGLKKNAFIHYWDMIPEDSLRLEAAEGSDSETSTPQRRNQQLAAEIRQRFPIGSEIVVQVTKGPIGTKGPRVSANLSIAGRYLVMLPGSSLKGVSRRIEQREERERLKKILARLPVPEGVGIIVRTAGLGTRPTAFARDLRSLLEIWRQIETGIRTCPAPCRLYQEPDLIERTIRDALTEDIDRIVVDSREEYERIKSLIARISRRARGTLKLYEGEAPIFDYYDIERKIENSLRRKVWLPSGGYIVIDETEAMVAIDVNTGRFKGGKSQDESILQVNLEAAEEIARQLRMRNVGGLVVIDFIDMKSRKDQQQVYRRMRECLRNDRARTNVLPISPLGLMEMTRQRSDESIRETASVNCPYCGGRGRVKSTLTMSVEIQRRAAGVLRRLRQQGRTAELRIRVNPAVLERLRREDEAALVELEERLGGRLGFVADPALHVEDFVIQDAATGEELFTTRET